ncbi:MAG: ShlB/FhaC/HecB family hemolysin secretion/activation protein [Ramlibacter sp.]
MHFPHAGHLNILLGASLLAATSAAQAQSTPPSGAPDAGRLLDQTRSALPAPQPARPVLQAPPASPPAPQDGTLVQVKAFAFSGNSVFTDDELNRLLADARGQTLRWSALRDAVQRITGAYQARGYLVARAVIPRQDLAAARGVLKVQLLEGRLGVARVSGATDLQAQNAVDATLEAQGLQTGTALRQAPLERALLLLGERLGGEAAAALGPGPTLGSTDVLIALPARPQRWQAQLSLDNQGNRYAGGWRVSGEAARQGLATRGDSLGLRAIGAQGLQYLGVAYQMPVGYDGWRLGASASALRYTLCCQFDALGARGDAQTLGFNARYPLVLRARGALTFTAATLVRNSRDKTNAGTVADKTARNLELGLAFNHAGALAGAAVPTGLLQAGQLVLTLGRLDLSAVAGAEAADAAGARTAGSFSKLRLDYQAALPLSPRTRLSLRLAAQAAAQNMDSAEKFSLGGLQGVRAWPTGEATGDEGYSLGVEWRQALAPCASEGCDGQWFASAFVDTGRIRQHHRPWAGALAASQRNSYNLSGAGLGLSYQSGPWQASLTVARALANNPGADASGNNSDGRQGRTRGWVQISRSL